MKGNAEREAWCYVKVLSAAWSMQIINSSVVVKLVHHKYEIVLKYFKSM